jgi:hypothetical protein
MDAAQFNGLLVPLPMMHTMTFVTTATNIADAGPGRSFVGMHIITAVGSSVTMTFKGAPAINGNGVDATPATADQIGQVDDASDAQVSKTVADTYTGYKALSSESFQGIRYLQVISSESLAGKVVYLVSKPV